MQIPTEIHEIILSSLQARINFAQKETNNIEAASQLRVACREALDWLNQKQLEIPYAMEIPDVVGLDMPDGVGWWAFQGVYPQGLTIPVKWVKELKVWDYREDAGVIDLQWEDDKNVLTVFPEYFQHIIRGKFYRLALPWNSVLNRLIPDWKEAPDTAMWWAVNAFGSALWWAKEPERIGNHAVEWSSMLCDPVFHRQLNIPIGIDWRTLKVKRPTEKRWNWATGPI